ncbi:C1QL [Mytilus coruscus]|uniref:C1QL n=1 Tax=Mytilus coruscus TaxID=42192 RepID=A0A6J8E9X2_MYTCO|nr:C1QL [Mytilus coruscus]
MLELREVVQKLDNVVQEQSARIYDLETTVTIQRNHIQDLMADKKTDIEYRRKLERRLKVIENNFVGKHSDPKDYAVKSSNIYSHENVDKQENTYYKNGIIGSVKEMVNPKLNAISRKDNIASDGLVAFYAYMSNPENNPSAHLTLIYDVSVTNVGNGYNHVTGIFTAPRSGVYVFIWVTRVYSGEHPTELMINNAVYGVTFLRARSGGDGSVSGTVVANVNKGDSVFVRVHSSYPGDGYIAKRLLLSPDNIASDGIVAFYAYMSNPEVNPSAHLTLIYDVSVTNVGNGYNHVTGIFTAPTSGVYVFIWVTRVASGEHPTQLMINNAVYGVTFLRAKNGDDGSVSGTVVAYVTKGDSVFVRVHSSYAGDGYIHSNEHGRPSFSGWLLH